MRPLMLAAAAAMLGMATALPTIREQVRRGLPRLAGVNLAGCDFGMSTDGSSGTSDCPGTDQIQHFVSQGVNLFRLPVGWQYLVGSNAASTAFDSSYFGTYDALVQACLAAGAYVEIDIHNYARWNGQIIGQSGGPTNAEFASLWGMLAAKYAAQPKVLFGIMNEPHDVDISAWATTVQAAVNAIRLAGAKTQYIVLPGNDYASAGTWSSGANDALLGVTDSTTGDTSLFLLDGHMYLDSDGSGTGSDCVTNNVAAMTGFAQYLQKHGRQGIITETGGGHTASCYTNLGEELQYIAQNSQYLVGFAVWAAGSFDPSYVLSLTPNADGTDQELWVQAVKPYLVGGTTVPTSTLPQSTSAVVTGSAALPYSTSTYSPPPAQSTSYPPAVYTSEPAGAVVTVTVTTVYQPPARNYAAETLSSGAPSGSETACGEKRRKRKHKRLARQTELLNVNSQRFMGSRPGGRPPVVRTHPPEADEGFAVGGQLFEILFDALSFSCHAHTGSCKDAKEPDTDCETEASQGDLGHITELTALSLKRA